MLTAKDFSRRYAKTYGVTYKQAEMICESVFELLRTVLYEDKEDFSIYGFGSFKHKTTSEKSVVHPVTRERILMPAQMVIKFTPSGVAYSSKITEPTEVSDEVQMQELDADAE